MWYLRRLPPLLRLVGITGLLLALALLAVSLSHFFHFFTALGLSPLDDDSLTSRPLSSLVLLSVACTAPIAWYILRLGRNSEIIRDTPDTRRVLFSVALLAVLPLVALALELFAPASAPIIDITFGLTILTAVSIIGWIVFFFSRPMATAGATGSPASVVVSAASTAAAHNADSAATPATAGSGGNAPMAPSAQTPTPFKSAWWSFDLGKYRPCDGTYCFYPYESIPPIRELNGTLDWLGPLDPQTDREMEIHRNAPEARGKLAEIDAEAAKLGLTLPESFVRLMGSPELQDRIPSCTACTFGLPNHIVPSPRSEQDYVIRFLNDQQDVLMWYLYLTPQGEQRVLVSPYELDDVASWNEGAGPTQEQRAPVIENTLECATSFEAFVYRWWLENTIWFALNTSDSDGKLTDEQRRYLAHYAPTPS